MLTILIRKTYILLLLVIAIGLTSCGKKSGGTRAAAKTTKDSTVILVEISDIDFMNPIIGTTVTTAQVLGLIYPSIVTGDFDTTKGFLTYKPALARSWDVAPDNKSITYHLRGDVKWTDGKPITSHDIKYSYELYADPIVASPRQDFMAELIHKKANSGKKTGEDEEPVDFDKAILTPNDTTLIFNFSAPTPTSLIMYHTTLPFAPKHVWEKTDRKEFRTAQENFKPTVTGGYYNFESWMKQQEVNLVANPKWNVECPPIIPRVALRIVPDYTNRLTQLKTGAVDVMEAITPQDAKKLRQENPEIVLKTVGNRVYDLIVWQNIDIEEYAAYMKSDDFKNGKTRTFKPHPLFGSKKVRQALTYGINRQAILDGFLAEYGRMMNGPITPAFKWAYNDKLKEYSYDKDKASKMLAEEGWTIGSDGILEKNGKKFSFSLFINSGNARRNYAATIVQQNLKELGIDCKIEQQEGVVFFERIRKHEYDACIPGLSVGLEIDPFPTFGSDLAKAQFNFAGYQNPHIDELCKKGKTFLNDADAAPIWKELQEIINEDQPATYLYWIEQIHGFNKRVGNQVVNILSTTFNLDQWTLSTLDPKPNATLK